MNISDIQKVTQDDMTAVNALILDSLRSDVALINQIGNYIVASGGKRLRPQLTVLAARACGYEGTQHHTLAAVIEFIHTSTLLHDDVVDSSDLRRGKTTANALFGNEAAVLVGDFLYSRSFELMVSVNSMRVMEILAKTTNIIAEGEVLQLLNIGDADTTEARYMDVIQSKTAQLFEAATQLGAVLSDQPQNIETALADYGRYLGTAFQLVDDLLDYSGNSEEMGKNVGDDLAEGKPTLPLIHVLNNGTAEQIETVKDAIKNADISKMAEIQTAIHETGALEYTRKVAFKQAELARQALTPLPNSKYKEAMIALALCAVERSE